MRSELSEGLRYLVGHSFWRPLSISIATNNFFSNVAWAILLVFAVRQLKLSPELIGLALALGSIGALAGALVVRHVPARFGVGPAIAGSSFLAGPVLLLVPFAPVSFPVIGQSFAFVPLVLSPLRSVRVMPEPEELPAVTAPLSAPTDA